MNDKNQVTDEDIIQAINEWPVGEADVEYTDVRTDRIHNPSSVSSFFLRNIRRAEKKTASPSDGDDNADEVLADVALAKWWRKTGRNLIPPANLPRSDNPNTIISYVTGTDEGLEFIHGEVKRLRDIISRGCKNVTVSSALSSFYEKLGNLSLAKMHLETVTEKTPHDKESRWRLLRLKRAIRYRRLQEETLREIDHNSLSKSSQLPEPTKVESVSAADLSYSDFFYKYALTSTPVVITGLVVDHMTSEPWNLQHISDVAGDCTVTVKKSVKDSVQWARLEDSKTMKVKDFISSLQDNSTKDEGLYLFDWSLPIHCPQLAHQLTIPKYFAGDFLQRTSPGSYYQDSWPSLFIAPQGVTSDLHVDAFGSNFWMALFQGKKRWTFFPPKDIALLYPEYSHPWSSDPVFDVDLGSTDLTQYPLLSCTHPVQCILQPGEVLFVPAGCPHRVENLETSLAISGNFVDLSNIHLVTEELSLTSLLDDRSCDLLKQLSDTDFPTSMSQDIDHLPWQQFKSWNKENYDKYDITNESVEKLRDKEVLKSYFKSVVVFSYSSYLILISILGPY